MSAFCRMITTRHFLQCINIQQIYRKQFVKEVYWSQFPIRAQNWQICDRNFYMFTFFLYFFIKSIVSRKNNILNWRDCVVDKYSCWLWTKFYWILDIFVSLYQGLNKTDSFCLSPYSITAALLLVIIGARGRSKQKFPLLFCKIAYFQKRNS